MKIIFLRVTIFTFLLLCLFTNSAYGQDFVINGLMYSVIDDNSVEIRGLESQSSVVTRIDIPDHITFNNQEYEVVSIMGERQAWRCEIIRIPSSIKK